MWQGGADGEAELLAGAHRRSLELAVEHTCRSIALPALSAGVYGYPLNLASQVALTTTISFLKEHARPALVRFVLFSDRAYDAFRATLEELTS